MESATGQFAKLPTCACRNHSPQLQIFWNLSLDSLLCCLHVLAEFPPPQFAHLWNPPLESLLSYLHVLAEIPPNQLQIFWNLPLDSLLSYIYVLAEIPSQFADFVKSSTGQFAKLPIYDCRNSPHPCLQILWNLPLDSLLSYLYVLAEIPPQFADFVKSATGQISKLPICACTNPPQLADFVKSVTAQFAKLPIYVCWNTPHPSLQILWNLPLDSLEVTYMCLLKFRPPQFADFVKSATGQCAKLPTCASRNFPPVCRFSEIYHWIVY